MKLKDEYAQEMMEQFEKDWKALQENLEKEICGVKFSDVIDLIERIHADTGMTDAYDDLFEEADLWTKFSEYDLHVRKNTESIVREYNRFYNNLWSAFEGNGRCQLVRFEIDGGGEKPIYRYVISTVDLFNIEAYSFYQKVVRRLSDNHVVNVEYKTLHMDEYMKLMNELAKMSNYKEFMGLMLLENDVYKNAYDTAEGCDDLDRFKSMTIKELKKLIAKERKRD
jgi:hypothetical protein